MIIRHKYVLILVVLSCILYLFQLGTMTLWDTDEALYTQIAREMTRTEDYITTQWNSDLWFCHPPLYFWLVILCSKIGGWTEFCARFPSALFGILLTILMFYLGKLLFNEKIGFYSGLISLTNLQLFLQSRMAILDMPFLFFIVLSVYCFLRGLFEDRDAYFAGFWLSSALAILSKGPVGVVLPVIYVAFYIFLSGSWKKIPTLLLSPWILVFLIISSFWYVQMSIMYGEPFVEWTFGYFFIKRIVAPVMNQGGEWYYYIPVFMAGFLPWTIFIPFTFYFLGKNFDDTRSRFLLSWVLFTFFLFTFAGTKRPNYILFIYPALSLALGWAMDSVFRQDKFRRSSHWSLSFFSVSTLLVIVAFIMVARWQYLEYYLQYGNRLLPLGAVLLGGGALSLIFSILKKKRESFFSIIAMTLLCYMVLAGYSSFVNSLKPEMKMARKINERFKSGDQLVLRGNFGRQFSVIFYTDKTARMYHSEEDMIKGINYHRKGYFIILHEDEFQRMKTQIRVPYEIMVEDGKLVLFYVPPPAP